MQFQSFLKHVEPINIQKGSIFEVNFQLLKRCYSTTTNCLTTNILFSKFSNYFTRMVDRGEISEMGELILRLTKVLNVRLKGEM